MTDSQNMDKNTNSAVVILGSPAQRDDSRIKNDRDSGQALPDGRQTRMTRGTKLIKNKNLQELQKELGIKNPMAIPMLSKIVVNIGVKDALSDKKNIEKVSGMLTQITSQKPKVTTAKKAIAGFKLREGDKIGLVVTLRGKKMYDFFTKLVSIVLPRFRDFHGVRKESFDGHGNYTLGLVENTVFPEIDIGKVDRIQGLEISIVTTAKNDKEGYALLKVLGIPFMKS